MKEYNEKFDSNSNFIEPKVQITVKQKIKLLITQFKYPFYNLFYKTLGLLMSEKKKDCKYYISICACFKNEAKYLREWIVYHNMIGVDHFYLYNNNSTDHYMNVLEPFINEGLVTLIDWPQVPAQTAAYKNWYENYRSESQWIALTDLDEFICPVYDLDLKTWLQKYKKHPVIKMDWLTFGTNANLRSPNGELVTEFYTNCWEKRRSTGKVIYNSSYDIESFFRGMMHMFSVKWHGISIPPINDSGNICLGRCIERVSSKKHTIQLNHYSLKSYDDLINKINRGSGAYKKSWKTMDVLMPFEYNNISSDFTIYRFLLALKARLEKYNE